MQVLFTRSTSILSRIIRYLTAEPVSHCAIRFEELVIHCNLLGVQIAPYREFAEKCEIIYSVEAHKELYLVFDLAYKYWEAKYDLGGLLYLGLRCLCPWLPKANLWQNTGMFLCTEFITEFLEGEEDHMTTPYQLYKRLLSQEINK